MFMIFNLSDDVLLGTLKAGETMLSITSSLIKSSSTIDIYTDKYGINPITVNVENDLITMTFLKQETDIKVKVVIK